MKIIYSDKQKEHHPRWEWNFGRRVPYPEKTSRIKTIVSALKKNGYSDDLVQTREFAMSHILKVHDRNMVTHIKSCKDLPEGESVYAHIFPYRSYDPHPRTDLKRAGYYCFDVGTQIDKNTFTAAKSAVDCAMHGAQLVRNQKEDIVFSLCRPPGHHAATGVYGGYCYFNNAAVAAYYLSQKGKVAILDLDFHHGNGTQHIFYQVPHIFFASIHGDPERHYPYFSGFRSEVGEGLGKGANLNVPLKGEVSDGCYQKELERVLRRIKRFDATFLIISMGFDTFHKDPAGDFNLSSEFFASIGELLARQNKPMLICMEGGYSVKELGVNAVNFCDGLCGRG